MPEGERAEVEAAMQKVAAAEKGVPSGSEPAPAAAAAAAELAAVVAAVLARDSVAPAVAAHCAALEAVLQRCAAVNARLAEHGEPAVIKEEVVAARLYTGP